MSLAVRGQGEVEANPAETRVAGGRAAARHDLTEKEE